MPGHPQKQGWSPTQRREVIWASALTNPNKLLIIPRTGQMSGGFFLESGSP